MRLLCFSDVHGNTGAVKAMLGDVDRRGVDYDAFVFAGDLTNLSRLGKTMDELRKLRDASLVMSKKNARNYVTERNVRFFEESKKAAREIIALLAGRGIPAYYIFGNRDRLGSYSLANFKSLFESPYAICLDHVPKAALGKGLSITENEKLIDGDTILVRHSPGGWRESYRVYRNALLNVTGHTHQAIVYKNFLNTGFLYRDETRGARPMEGGYFDVEIDDDRLVRISYNDLGGLVEHDFVLEGIKGKVYSVHKSYFPFRLEFF